MHNLIEYVNNYSKLFGSLWKYYSDEPVENDLAIANSKWFKFNANVIGKPLLMVLKSVEIAIIK